MVDAADSKSACGDTVEVRVLSPVPVGVSGDTAETREIDEARITAGFFVPKGYRATSRLPPPHRPAFHPKRPFAPRIGLGETRNESSARGENKPDPVSTVRRVQVDHSYHPASCIRVLFLATRDLYPVDLLLITDTGAE